VTIPGGFSQLFNRAIDTGAYARASTLGRALYPVLVRKADPRDRFRIKGLGLPTMIRLSGLSRNSVRDGIKSLCDVGLLRVVNKGVYLDYAPGIAAEYELLLPDEPHGFQGHPSTGFREPPPRVTRRTSQGSRGARSVKTGVKNNNNRPSNRGAEIVVVAEAIAAEGVDPNLAIDLAGRLDADYVYASIRAVKGKRGIRDRAAYLARWLTCKWQVSEKAAARAPVDVTKHLASERAERDRCERAIEAWLSETPPADVEAEYRLWSESLPAGIRGMSDRRGLDSPAFRAHVAEMIEKR
jgi:hypothetical protein